MVLATNQRLRTNASAMVAGVKPWRLASSTYARLAGSTAPPDIVAARDRIVREFFHANDGRAAERAAAVVAGAARAAAPGRLTRRAYVRRIVTAPPGVAGQVRRAVLMVAGNGAYRLLRSVAGRTRMTAAKHFGVGDVADVLGRLAAVRPDWPALRARAAGHAAVEVVTA